MDHPATVQLTVSDGLHPSKIEASELAQDYRMMALDAAKLKLAAAGFGLEDEEVDIIHERNNEIEAGLVIRVERKGEWDGPAVPPTSAEPGEGEDAEGGDETVTEPAKFVPVKIYVSDGPTEQYQRAQLFASCENKEVEEVRALLTAAGYTVDEGVDMQASESVTYNHVICVGLVRETEENGEKIEEIVTGDDVPMDIKRVRLIVSSGPETSGDSSTPVSITRQKLGPSWSVLDPASGVSDAKLIDGTYPTWYGQPQKIDNARYLTGMPRRPASRTTPTDPTTDTMPAIPAAGARRSTRPPATWP